MSKELEALNGLFDLIHCQDSFGKAQKYFDIIEEGLTKVHKALEFIKKIFGFDLVEIGGRKVCIYPSNDNDDVVKTITEEEFNVLKEVLE